MNKYLVIIILLIFVACDKDLTPGNSNINNFKNGVFILNEGNFQFGNASINFFNLANKKVVENLFFEKNKRPLGDVCQSMSHFGNYFYIVLNNSQKIEIVNDSSFKSVATITGFASPRYFLPINNNTAYVTDLTSNKISIVDLGNHAITGSITCSGWTEDLVLANGKVFITNLDSNKLFVVDPKLHKIVHQIQIEFGANSIKEDKNGKLWILCRGKDGKNKRAALYQIDPIDHKVLVSHTFPSNFDQPWRLQMNKNLDSLFYLNKDVFAMGIHDQLPNVPYIKSMQNNFYALGIDPRSNDLYVSDALDYTQKGVIFRFSGNKKPKDTLVAGIIPGGFYFH